MLIPLTRQKFEGSVLDVLLGSGESLPGQSSSSSGDISETPPDYPYLRRDVFLEISCKLGQ